MVRFSFFFACVLAALTGYQACSKKPPASSAQGYFHTHSMGLQIPKTKGWIQDITPSENDTDTAGTLLRLVREASVPGSPRIEITAEPVQQPPVTTDSFLEQNLTEMGLLEKNADVTILEVNKTKTTVGDQEAYRVQYTYHVGHQPSTQVSITQWSVFMVLENRGVAITAAGRTELFHPVAQDIDHMLNNIRLKR